MTNKSAIDNSEDKEPNEEPFSSASYESNHSEKTDATKAPPDNVIKRFRESTRQEIINKHYIEEDIPKIEIQEVELDLLELDEAIEELFEKINPLTIPSVFLGVILLIISYTVPMGIILTMIVGFAGGLSFVFGCSELIIIGVKGIGKKFGWSEYFMGIVTAVGADSSDVVVVTILLFRSKTLGESELATDLQLTSITYVLTTVLINSLILGITMIVVSRKGPFQLPRELSFTESNVVLAMTIFSFILMIFGITHETIALPSFDIVFQAIIGGSLLIFYIIFVVFLIRQTNKDGLIRTGPQTLISEYFADEESKRERREQDTIENVEHEIKATKKVQTAPQDNIPEQVWYKQLVKRIFRNGGGDDEREQLIALRRFPWYILFLIFIIGIAGILFGGNMLSNSIEIGLSELSVPILVYVVVVGLVASTPEMTITLRAILTPDIENEDSIKIGLVHQVSSLDQTFFVLFGFPFLFASFINITIPVALDLTLVFAGIFVISLGLHLTIIDDNKFDMLEGALILLTSISSLLALASVGDLLPS
ncbi:MAG: hypothetical protein GF308_05245 [Candidatus Heimdallarchaeota archaeon]|nr:hypothetical protein [Candidatus Heimdallarchaeota archaeon]